jgi:hypothetical protein
VVFLGWRCAPPTAAVSGGSGGPQLARTRAHLPKETPRT